MIAFKCSGIKSLNMLVLKPEGTKDSDSNGIHVKRRKYSKIRVFLTDPGLRDMSRKSVQADVKRKFDMLSVQIARVLRM